MLDGTFKHLTYMYGEIICTVLFSSYWYELFSALWKWQNFDVSYVKSIKAFTSFGYF